MKINADLSRRVVQQSASLPWVDSPVAGIQRKGVPMLVSGGV